MPTTNAVPSSFVSFTASAVTPNGEIVVAGAMYDPDQLRPIVARFRSDGSLDPSFGEAGYVVLDGTESPNPPDAVAVGPSGEITLSGPGRRLVRLTGAGELDRSFGADGVAVPVTAGRSAVHDLAVDSAGRTLIAGSTGNTLAVERFTTDGRPDHSFDGDGLAVASPVPAGSLQGLQSFQQGEVVVARPDDRVLVVGEALLDSGDAEVVAAQFNPDGTPDASFNGDGASRIPVTAPFGTPSNPGYFAARAIALDQAGLAAVRLAPETAFPDAPAFCRGGSALRLDPDGTLDPGFGIASLEPPGECPSDLVSLDAGAVFAVGRQIVKEGPNSVTQTLYAADGRFDPTFGPQPRELMLAGLASRATSVQRMPSGVLISVGSADIDTCITPGSLQCTFGFLLAQQPNGDVIDDFGVHGVATLPRVPICRDPFDRCPYPPRSEFRRLARQSVSRTTYLARRTLRTDVECDFEIQEPCEVRARFRTPQSHRTLAKVRRTSIPYGDAQPVRSRRISGAALATIADRSHLDMKVVVSAEHQRPVRFAQGVRRRKPR